MSRTPRSRSAAGALLLAGCVLTAPARAQTVQAYAGAGGSVTIPTRGFHADARGDGYNVGWQGMLLFAFKLPQLPLGFRLEGTYGENLANAQLNADVTAATGAPAAGKTKLFGGNLELTYEISSPFALKPYLLYGVGFCNVKYAFTSRGVTADTSQTKFAWNAGAGVNYTLAGVAVFVEARYFDIAAFAGVPKTTLVPITAGIRLRAL